MGHAQSWAHPISFRPAPCHFMPEIDPEWLFSGFSASQGPQGCSCWSKMVPGHWYTVPHYVAALPARILGFKITNLAKNAPKIVILSCILVVVGLQRPPVMFKLVQNGPRPLHSGARSTTSGPTGCLKTNGKLFVAILVSLSANPTIAPKSV